MDSSDEASGEEAQCRSPSSTNFPATPPRGYFPATPPTQPRGNYDPPSSPARCVDPPTPPLPVHSSPLSGWAHGTPSTVGSRSTHQSIRDTPSTPAAEVCDPPTPEVVVAYAQSPELDPPAEKRSRRNPPPKQILLRDAIKRQLLQEESCDNDAQDATAPPASLGHQETIQLFVQCESESESGSSDSDYEAENVVAIGNVQIGDEDQSTSDDSPETSSSESSSESDSDSHDSESEDLLFPGANQTVAEAVLKIMNLYVKHRWSQKCLKDTIKTFCDLLPQPNELPSSVYKMFQYVEEFSSVPSVDTYWYCSNRECFKPKESREEKCSSCGNDSSSKFFHFPLSEQIKYLFEHRNLAEAIDSYRTQQQQRSTDGISDISSGSEYIELKSQLKGAYDLVLLWNTDGVPMAKSSGTQMHPVLAVPSEVSPAVRSSFLIIVGVWCDVTKPPMNMFLRPFASALETLNEVGVEWKHPATGEENRSVIVAPVFSGDAPATAEAFVVQYFCSLWGCNTCEQKRALVAPTPTEALNSEGQDNQTTDQNKKGRKTGKKKKGSSKAIRRFVHQDREARLRTGPRMDRQGEEAEKIKKPVKGVLGNAVVSKIPHFDRGKGKAAEYMHAVLLGVVKYFTLLWCVTAGPWFIGNHLKDVDAFLLSTKVPHFVNRPPKAISDAKYWKASEFRSWLLYYSLPAMNGILPDPYYQHWILLVTAIYLLLSENITDDALRTSAFMLKTFVRDIKDLYGLQYYSYNVHILTHLPLLVSRWGPLWATSAFVFESYNGVLGSLIHGTKNKGQEVVNQIRRAQGVVCLRNFVERSHGKKTAKKSGRSSCHGKRISLALSPDQHVAINLANLSNYIIYGRASCKSEMYSSVVYDKKKKRVNSYVKFIHVENKNIGYAQIEFFLKSEDEVYAMLRILAEDLEKTLFHKETLFKVFHLIPFKESNSLLVVPIELICLKTVRAGSFLCLRPNTVECNM